MTVRQCGAGVLAFAWIVSTHDCVQATAPFQGVGVESSKVTQDCGPIATASAEFSDVLSTYRTTGECGVTVHTLVDGKEVDSPRKPYPWSGQGTYNPLTQSTVEVIAVYDPAKATVLGTFTATMRCVTDPWRQPDGKDCDSFHVKVGGAIDANVYHEIYKSKPLVPATSKVSSQLRASLQQQYARFVQLRNLQNTQQGATTKRFTPAPSATQKALGNTAQVAPRPIAIALLTITLPSPKSHVAQGKLQVNASPPATFKDVATADAWLEFTWLDTPATFPPSPPYSNGFSVPLSKLMGGYVVPAAVTAGRPGRWRVQARITKPVDGAWSTPVEFVMDPK